jgi:hypothetical protein
MVLVQNKIKLIDYGQSKLIEQFHERGTIQPIIVSTLFNDDIKYKRISILSDVFSVCLSLLYSIYIIHSKKTVQELDKEKLTYDMLTQYVYTNKLITDKLTNIILLADFILLFYKLMQIHATNIKKNDENLDLKNIYDTFIDIKHFNINNITNMVYNNITSNLETVLTDDKKKINKIKKKINKIKKKIQNYPIYNNTNNKLFDDYNYVNKIIGYFNTDILNINI